MHGDFAGKQEVSFLPLAYSYRVAIGVGPEKGRTFKEAIRPLPPLSFRAPRAYGARGSESMFI